jgi:hypothetical protein
MVWIAIALSSSAGAQSPPAPPPALAPYFADGEFNPTDFKWLRGAFAGASASQRAGYEQAERWAKECFSWDNAEVRRELSAMGVAADHVALSAPKSATCGTFMQPMVSEFRSFAELEAADDAAKPIVESFLYGVKLAEDSSPPPMSPGELLRFRPLSEQMIRKALSWGEASQKGAPPLAPAVKRMVQLRLGVAMARYDHANSAWLGKMIDAVGWPRISSVGPEASSSAWLLVQHADADPALQLKALRLMEPLVGAGEVDKKNYAYLYDRVMLKITGKQRYGTQMTCKAGQRVPQALENETGLDRLRAEVGLSPMIEYQAQMRNAFGDCPKGP